MLIHIYLASTYSEHPTMRIWRDKIEGLGDYKITSRWITGSHEIAEGNDDSSINARFALEDLHDIEKAHLFILDMRKHLHSYGRGGRHVEFGYAMGIALPIWLVGNPRNVFNHLPNIRVFSDEEDLFAYMMTMPRSIDHLEQDIPVFDKTFLNDIR